MTLSLSKVEKRDGWGEKRGLRGVWVIKKKSSHLTTN
jgi:hypothetical protein